MLKVTVEGAAAIGRCSLGGSGGMSPPEFLSLLRVVLRHSETVLRSYSSCVLQTDS